MTVPANGAQPTVIELPKPEFPMLMRVISNALFPAAQTIGCPHCAKPISIPELGKTDQDPVTWVFGEAHPLTPDMRIIRMFIKGDGIEIYSVPGDTSKKSGVCTRNLIPMSSVRFTEEAMPINVFVEELIDASEDDDDDDDDDDNDDPEAEPAEGGPALTTDGSSAS